MIPSFTQVKFIHLELHDYKYKLIRFQLMIKQKEDEPLIQQQPRYKSKMQIFKMSSIIALSSIYFGYVQVYLGAIKIETIVKVYNVDFDQSLAQGLLNGCIPFGAIFGSLSIQLLLSKLSRRKSLLLVNLVAFVVGILIYIPNVYSLIVFRLIQGICTGFYSGLPSLIIKQLSPVQVSGTMGTFTQLNLTSGIILAYLITYILKKITGDLTGQAFWFIQFGFPLITISIQTVLLIYVFPYETPKYLLMSKRQGQAQELIRLIYKEQYVEQVLQQKLQDIKKIEQSRLEQNQIQQNPNQSLLSQREQGKTVKKNVRLAIIMSIHVAIFQQLSGVNVLNVYCGSIVQKIVSGELKLLVPTLLISAKLMGTVMTSNVISCLGRKTILQLGLLLLAVGNTSISLGFYLKGQQQSIASMILIVAGMFFFLTIFGFTAGPVVWIYLSQTVQPKYFSIAVGVLWLFSTLIVMLFPLINQKVLDGDPFFLFLLFGFYCIFSFIINYFFMVQTKNKTQKQIQQQYESLKIC